MALVEDVAARLRVQVPSRTVYEHAVPDGALPAAYLLVRGGVTSEFGERACGSTHVGDAAVWVLSAARHGDPHVAARTSDAGATFARDALRDYRPSSGRWRMRLALADPDPRRDESISDTTFVLGLQYALRTDL